MHKQSLLFSTIKNKTSINEPSDCATNGCDYPFTSIFSFFKVILKALPNICVRTNELCICLTSPLLLLFCSITVSPSFPAFTPTEQINTDNLTGNDVNGLLIPGHADTHTHTHIFLVSGEAASETKIIHIIEWVTFWWSVPQAVCCSHWCVL